MYVCMYAHIYIYIVHTHRIYGIPGAGPSGDAPATIIMIIIVIIITSIN